MLNKQQSKALKAIKEFLESDTPAFLLKGYAGTGKTYLMRALGEYLTEQKRDFALLAPTGRAARVIEQRTELPASTIHGEIYGLERFLEEVIVEHDGRREKTYKLIFKLRDDMTDEGKVFIVDEASMVSDVENDTEFLQFGSGKLLRDLIQYARLNVPTFANRIIFVGDPMQLPPVEMNTSPALDAAYLKNEYGLKSSEYTLTQIMRQEAGLILSNAMRIRDMVDSFHMRRFEITTDGKTVTAVTRQEALDAAMNGPAYRRKTVFITYTNAAALRFNETFRERLWGDGMLPVQKGDLLMVVRNSHKYQIFNGDLCVVREVAGNPESIYVKNFNLTLYFRDVTIGYYGKDGHPVGTRCKILENALHEDTATVAPEIARALYVDFCIRHPNLSPKKQPKEFGEALLGDEYFNALLVKYGYAITCNKAQGGEWERAIVYFEKGGQVNDAWLRWCYTAVTRARNELFVIDAPAVRGINADELEAVEHAAFVPYSVGLEPPPTIDLEKSLNCNETDNVFDVSVDMVDDVMNQVSESNDAYRSIAVAADSKETQQAPSSWPAEYPFLRGKFRGFSERLTPHGLVIQKVDCQADKYFVRYTVGKDNLRVCIQCYFKANGVFKQPQMYQKDTTSPELFNMVCESFQSAPVMDDAPNIDRNFPFQYPFLEKLYSALDACCKKHGSEITGLEHLPYTERYTVKGGLDACVFDIHYGGNQRISDTRIVPARCTTQDFAAEVLAWLKTEGLA